MPTPCPRRGWAYRAAIVSLEGLGRFRPDEWKDGLHPDWATRSKKNQTTAGATIQTLANRAMNYAQALTSRAGGAVAKKTLDSAIDYMRIYDPANVEENAEFLQVIIMMQEGEYYQARVLAEKIGQKAMKNGNKLLGLKALRFAVDGAYRHWQTFLDQDPVNEKKMEEAEKDLDKLVTFLGQVHPSANWQPE